MSRDLRPLFDPRSVAIVGASGTPGKWGHWLARGALEAEQRRTVYLVNRNGGEILGRDAFRSLADVPEAPELVVVTVPAGGFEEAVDDALEAGAKALVVISAGLGESGPEGQARERAAVERVRAAGAVLVGPNCLGVFDAGTVLHLSSDSVPSGPIGLISQSGNLALEVGMLAADVGLGFSRFVSIGNQADLVAADLIDDLAAHEPTKVIAVYCEDFKDGRAFARAAQRAVEGGKPVLLLAGGGTAASARAARSHTGALVSDAAAVEAACAAAGIQRVATPSELVDAALALLRSPAPSGRRVAVVADGGGSTVIAADLAAAHGLELPRLSEGTAGALAELLPSTAATANPVDLAGGGERDVFNFARVVETLLRSPDADTVFLTGYFGGYSSYSEGHAAREVEAATAMGQAAAETGKPLVVQTMYWRSAAADALRAGGVAVYRDLEGALHGIAALVRAGAAQLRGVPDLPEPAQPVSAAGYREARELLEEAGVEFAEARSANDAAGALSAAAELGYPIVLKALGQLHKSDAGGVAVGVPDAVALERELSQMATLSPSGYSVERTAPLAHGIELIVGVRRDPRFGPVTLVGMGGLYTELLSDVAVALAPLDEREAERLLESLRGAPLLKGTRGRPALDVRAAAKAAAALSQVAATHREIAELEINPLLVLPEGAIGLDARIVLGERGDSDAS
ncbi:MAG TPA: acetate--CoA ligase family protein [Gaiellaceae bacterium]